MVKTSKTTMSWWRPSPAMAVALIALFVALGGGAYALTIPRNSVGSEQLKQGSVTGAKLANGAVTSAKVKDGSLLTEDFKAGQLPRGAKGNPGPTGNPGAKGDKGDPATKLFATIHTTASVATLIHGSGVANIERLGTGITRVTFTRSVSPAECAILAGVGAATNERDLPNLSAFTLPRAAYGGGANQVDVYTFSGASFYDTDFHIAAFC
jgi:hypothetical protein